MITKPIAELMTKEVVQIPPATTLAECAELMAARRISSLIVSDRDMPLGILTERDLVRLLSQNVALDQAVRDLMAAPLVTVRADTDYRDAYHLLIKHNIRHLVVVDDQQRMTGIVTETDYRRHSGIEEFIGLRTIASIMDTDVLAMPAYTRVADAATLMHSQRRSCAIVIEGLKPVGIITERDMVGLYQRQLGNSVVAEIMSSPVATVRPEQLVIDAVQIMQTGGIRHLAVVDVRGDMLAVVSEHDVVKHNEGHYVDLLNKIIEEQLTDLQQKQAKIDELTYQTALLASEQKLYDKQRTFDTVVENALDAFVLMDSQGMIVGWNKLAEKTFGWNKAEAMGKPLHTLIIPPAYRDQHLRGMGRFLASGEHLILNKRIEINALDRQGREFPIELSVTPIKSMEGHLFASFIRDISERKRIEEEMSVASLIYMNSSEAMMVTDADGAILNVNPAFTALTGYRLEEIAGKNSSILSSDRHDQEFFRTMWHKLNTVGIWQGEVWNRRKNREIYAEWLTINTIYKKDGTPYRRVALFSDITEKKQSEELIWTQANFDALTGLPNRRMFQDRLEFEIKKSRRAGLSMALMYIDLDRFKEVNDILGHHVGDLLLKDTALRLRSCVRETDTVARLGGDEFTVILSELDDPAGTARIAQQILDKLTERFQLQNESIYISASIGITLYPDDAGNIEDLRKNADQAMYAAKQQGRNRFSFFTPILRDIAQNRLQITRDLRQALVDKQFVLHYQPIVDLSDGSIRKAEALIRWQHPQRGLIGPSEFISIAEDTGMILAMGDWVFQQATSQVRQWRTEHCPEFQISINKSPVQFQNDDTLYKIWLQRLIELGLTGQSIVIEITENPLLERKAIANEKLLEFRDAGIQVAIDDFGTGYSSLAYLKHYHIDYLKIDQTFICNLNDDASDRVLCEAIIVMAHKLGMKVIAEGVETEQQRDFLRAAGCDFGQGYLFSRPLPATEFEALLHA